MPTASRRRDTPPPRTANSEADVLRGFLDYLRASIAKKVDGAPEPRVRTPAVPSGTNLLGLLNHLIAVEKATFLGETVTDWPATFHPAPQDSDVGHQGGPHAAGAGAGEGGGEGGDAGDEVAVGAAGVGRGGVAHRGREGVDDEGASGPAATALTHHHGAGMGTALGVTFGLTALLALTAVVVSGRIKAPAEV